MFISSSGSCPETDLLLSVGWSLSLSLSTFLFHSFSIHFLFVVVVVSDSPHELIKVFRYLKFVFIWALFTFLITKMPLLQAHVNRLRQITASLILILITISFSRTFKMLVFNSMNGIRFYMNLIRTGHLYVGILVSHL